MKNTILLLLLICIVLPSKAQNLYFPPNTGLWQTTSTDSLNWCTTKLDELQLFLDRKNTKAFLILKDGKIAAEWYFDDFTKDSVWYWASAGKSLMATLVGIAQQEGKLTIQDKTADYLGAGWTNCATTEASITIRNQLSMTSGLNDATSFDCTAAACLTCKAPAGERWAYHNGPYSLLREVVETATGTGINAYYTTKIGSKIGASGGYIKSGFNNLFISTPRDMARFGLMILAGGNWNGTQVLADTSYFNAMMNTSQQLNPSYGFLWWLNGKGKHKQPGLQIDFPTDIIPSAPADLVAAMGKNEQRIYVVPSENMVVVRMGENAEDSAALALSGFDDELWTKIMDLTCTFTALENTMVKPDIKLFPNPSTTQLTISTKTKVQTVEIVDILGQKLLTFHGNATALDIGLLDVGIYFAKIYTTGQSQIIRFIKQ